MDSPFVRCLEEIDHQKPLAVLFEEFRRRPTFPTFVATNLLCLPQDLGSMYFVANSSYWSRYFHFEACIRGGLSVFAVWQYVEIVSMPVPDRLRDYCPVSVRLAQYDASVLFSVPTPLVLSYNSRLAMRESADYKSRVCTTALTVYVFMARAMLVVSARDERTPRY